MTLTSTDLLEHPAMKQWIPEQERFDATRPPCPPWCDRECEDAKHLGDAVMHNSAEVQIPTIADWIGHPGGTVLVSAQRYDSLTESTASAVIVDVADAQTAIDDRANLSAQQARQMAAALLRAADLIDPPGPGEVDVPATEARIGDSLPVGDGWQYVYGVFHDEPSFTVQLFTTVAPGDWPELDGGGDEDPYQCELTETVRIRRADGGTR